MSGTKEGGLKAAQTNKKKYGEDFYVKIGFKGGEVGGGTGGFAATTIGKDGLTGRQRAVIVGKIGGQISRRGPSKLI